MPATRKTVHHLDRIDRHRESVTRAGLVIRTAFVDGRIDPSEHDAILDVVLALEATFAPLPDDAMRLDATARLIGLLADTGDPSTPKAQRVIRETTADLLALSSPAVLDEAA